MARRPWVDPEKCIGASNCAFVCPRVFRIKDGKSEVYDPGGDTEALIQEAIYSCPVGAISWVEE